MIGLSATKDVQDAILADPVRSKIVSVIDIQYWWYQSDGSLYTPQGGKNLAPRQHERVHRLLALLVFVPLALALPAYAAAPTPATIHLDAPPGSGINTFSASGGSSCRPTWITARSAVSAPRSNRSFWPIGRPPWAKPRGFPASPRPPWSRS